ncbi:hypothetical protein RUND412_001952 [Rhizina undulata]
MSENQSLLDKIGQLAGQINRHKNQQEQLRQPYNHYQSFHNNSSYHPYSRGRGHSVWRPSTRGRGRGGRILPVTHHNRTLVINNKKPAATTPDSAASSSSEIKKAELSEGSTGASTSSPSSNADKRTPTLQANTAGWIAKRDRHMQLINSSVYDAQARTKAIEQTRQEKLKKREEREKLKLKRFFQRSQQPSSYGGAHRPNDAHQVEIGGITYRVAAGGSKLVKVPDDHKLAMVTPKKAVVGGVNFVRSKNGNLWRSGLVKASRNSIKQHTKINKPCIYFTSTGQCKNGTSCPYVHDPNKVAICLHFLSNTCTAGDACDLSHDPNPHRVPACYHFVRGNCSNLNCQYAHVRVNPAARICRDFATLGYCEKGAECVERHVHECPDYNEKGVCDNEKCKLPHIERAGRIRQAAAAQAAAAAAHGPEIGSEDNKEDSVDSDLSSDDEEREGIDSDDVDSDALSDYDFIGTDDRNERGHDVTLQHDFIQF